jgi:hypothetical protein
LLPNGQLLGFGNNFQLFTKQLQQQQKQQQKQRQKQQQQLILPFKVIHDVPSFVTTSI